MLEKKLFYALYEKTKPEQGHYLFLIKIKLLLAFETKERIITIAGHSLSLDPT